MATTRKYQELKAEILINHLIHVLISNQKVFKRIAKTKQLPLLFQYFQKRWYQQSDP